MIFVLAKRDCSQVIRAPICAQVFRQLTTRFLPLSQIFHRDPLFHGSSNEDQLVKIARVLGTDDLWQYLDRVSPLVFSRTARLDARH